ASKIDQQQTAIPIYGKTPGSGWLIDHTITGKGTSEAFQLIPLPDELPLIPNLPLEVFTSDMLKKQSQTLKFPDRSFRQSGSYRVMQDNDNSTAASEHSILYVEDNDDNIYMLTRRLRRRKFIVHEARTGAEGVELARKLVPSLIIMDLILPDIHGCDATRQLKADSATTAIPVIALSAHASTEDRDSALSAGCIDFDTKPVDFDRLMTKIELAIQ
ncbi:MAG: response regulator, partial [Acidiferrobacterales bacterium]|nr:response regulator [Acidiferrobacterales bacterium]